MSAKKTVANDGAKKMSGAEEVDQILELTADLQRTRADFENFRKQSELQRAHLAKVVEQSTIMKLLPVIDTVQIAIQHNPALEPVLKTVEKSLAELNLVPIEAKPGTVFNPDVHEAVQADDKEGETEVVETQLRPGYTLDGEVLRPAMVTVTHK